MDLENLLNAVRVMDYWGSGDEAVIKELLTPRTDIVKRYVKPFRRELDLNLLAMESHNGKRDMLKFYVAEFWDLQGFFNEYLFIWRSGFTNIGATKRYTVTEGKKQRKLNRFENYWVECWTLCDMLFTEIQLCCFKFNVDFFEICDELKFRPNFFDTSVSWYMAERKLKEDKSETFEYYLIQKKGKLLPYLKKTYSDSKPETIAYMIFALLKANLLNSSILSNQTKFHLMLKNIFGIIGTRQSLNINITKLRNPDNYQQNQIDIHSKEILTAISGK